MSVTLGIDIGTSGTKTLAIDERGQVLASASVEYPARTSQAGVVGAGPRTVVDCDGRDDCKAVVAKAGLKPADVAGIGLSGQMHGSVFLDSSGRSDSPSACSGTTSGPRPSAREIEEGQGGGRI